MTQRLNKISVLLLFSLLILFYTGCGGKEDRLVEEHMVAFRNGLVAMERRDYKAAEIQFKKAIKDYPDSAPYHNYLGLAYFFQKKYNEALLEYDKGLRITTEYGDLYNNRGLAYLELGQTELALDEFKKALKIKTYPTPENAYFNIGRVYFGKQQWVEAAFNFKKSIDSVSRMKNKKTPQAHAFYGISLVKQGKYYDSLEPLKNALKIQPKLMQAHYYLGIAYYNLNQPKRSLNHFMEVQSVISTSDPLYPELKEYITKVKSQVR